MLLNHEDSQKLLEIARNSIVQWLDNKKNSELSSPLPESLILENGSGAFVTLNRNNQLRGCIGLMESNLCLAVTVQRMALAAAFEDQRFPELRKEELEGLSIEISVLFPKRLVASIDEIELGQDGVLVEAHGQSGVFLPQVATETGWSKERFLSELCEHKAGLVPDAWQQEDTKLFAFRAQILSEAK